MRYEISEQLEIRMFRQGEDVPFLYQPHYPDGAPFESAESAQAWAEQHLAILDAENV